MFACLSKPHLSLTTRKSAFLKRQNTCFCVMFKQKPMTHLKGWGPPPRRASRQPKGLRLLRHLPGLPGGSPENWLFRTWSVVVFFGGHPFVWLCCLLGGWGWLQSCSFLFLCLLRGYTFHRVRVVCGCLKNAFRALVGGVSGLFICIF